MAGTQNLTALFPPALKASSNLSDLTNISAALTALGLGTTAAAELARIGAAPVGSYAALDDVRILAIAVAKLTGSTLGLAAGVADDFRDQTGVDTVNSVNATYDSSNKVFNNVSFVVETTQSLPAMTSNTTPSGYVASASNETGQPAYLAFDQSSGTGYSNVWYSNSVAPQWLQRQGPAMTVGAYSIRPRSDDGSTSINPPTGWSLLGSNDGAAWTTLDTQTNQTLAVAGNKYTIPAGNRGNYTYYRLNITTGGVNGLSVSEMQFFKMVSGGTTAAGPLDLRSVAYPASAVPTKGSIFLLAAPLSGTITSNTNFTASLSRNGGTNWGQVTLTAGPTLSSGFQIFEANGVDLTAQPSGQSMKWRVQTAGSLAVQVQAVVDQWG